MARKTYRRKYSRKGRHTIKGRYTRKARKYSRKGKRGGNGDDKVNCCMCGKEVEAKLPYSLNPGKCLRENGLKAHRICEKCWFDGSDGSNGSDAFAAENRNHDCPGCKKGLPFTKVSEVPQIKGEIIDLTEE